jgi:hypothetical protein
MLAPTPMEKVNPLKTYITDKESLFFQSFRLHKRQTFMEFASKIFFILFFLEGIIKKM